MEALTSTQFFTLAASPSWVSSRSAFVRTAFEGQREPRLAGAIGALLGVAFIVNVTLSSYYAEINARSRRLDVAEGPDHDLRGARDRRRVPPGGAGARSCRSSSTRSRTERFDVVRRRAPRPRHEERLPHRDLVPVDGRRRS